MPYEQDEFYKRKLRRFQIIREQNTVLDPWRLNCVYCCHTHTVPLFYLIKLEKCTKIWAHKIPTKSQVTVRTTTSLKWNHEVNNKWVYINLLKSLSFQNNNFKGTCELYLNKGILWQINLHTKNISLRDQTVPSFLFISSSSLF